MSASFGGIRYLSSFLFGCNYAGVIYGAFTFLNESEEKKKVSIAREYDILKSELNTMCSCT